jgi:hypothetical protein
MAGLRDAQFLKWVADRFVNVYNESPNVDFVLRLHELAAHPDDESERLREADWLVRDLYKYVVHGLRCICETCERYNAYAARYPQPTTERDTPKAARCGAMTSSGEPCTLPTDHSLHGHFASDPSSEVRDAKLRGLFLDEIKRGHENDYHIPAQWLLIFDRFEDYLVAKLRTDPKARE